MGNVRRGHATFTETVDRRGMRLPLALLAALTVYLVWATTFAAPAVTSLPR